MTDFAGAVYESDVVGAVIEQLATSRPDPDAILKTATSTLSKLRPGTWVAARISRDASTARVVARSDSDPEMAPYVLDMPVSDRLSKAPIYSSVIETAVAGLRVDAADILLLDESDGLLALVAGTGFQSTSIPDYRLPLSEALPGQALARRRIEAATVQGTLTHFRRRSLFAREGFKYSGHGAPTRR